MLVHDYLEYWSRTAPDRVCVEDGTTTLTYRDVDRLADRVAQELARLGVASGDRVAILSMNCSAWAPLYYGAFKAGVVPVPLNFRLHPQEWRYQLDDSGARVIFAQAAFAEGIDGVRSELSVDAYVSIDGPREGWTSLEELLDAQRSGTHRGPALEQGSELYQMYTSGTTGRPKGAVITHAAADANLTQIRTFLPLYQDEGTLLVAPLFHAAAAMSLFWYVACGATAHVQPAFDPQRCLDLLDSGTVASATFVPAMIQVLAATPEARGRQYPGLRNLVYGASPIAEETLRRAMEIFDCDFVQGYGQTECCSTLTFLGPEEHRRALAGEGHLLLSCGRPVVGTEIRLVSSLGDEVGTGEVGEILARGPQVMKGYWNLPEATAATLADGWLHTGDAGYLDEEGYLYISDRVKDLIVSGAENIYPREIEDVLFRLPGIADAAVIGVPDERWGETVKACVVLDADASLSDEDVIAHCREHLATYKCPRSVDFLDELPRNATGKVLKTVLREPYWEGQVRRVAG